MTTAVTAAPVPAWQEIAGTIAEAGVAFFEANQATVTTYLGTLEDGGLAELTKELALLPQPTGLAGVVLKVIEAQGVSLIESQAQALITKYGPAVLFSIIDTRLKQYAAAIGG